HGMTTRTGPFGIWSTKQGFRTLEKPSPDLIPTSLLAAAKALERFILSNDEVWFAMKLCGLPPRPKFSGLRDLGNHLGVRRSTAHSAIRRLRDRRWIAEEPGYPGLYGQTAPSEFEIDVDRVMDDLRTHRTYLRLLCD